MITKQDYINDAFNGDLAQAVEFENQCLSISREFMPFFVTKVLDGDTPDSRYWGWLIEQKDKQTNTNKV